MTDIMGQNGRRNALHSTMKKIIADAGNIAVPSPFRLNNKDFALVIASNLCSMFDVRFDAIKQEHQSEFRKSVVAQERQINSHIMNYCWEKRKHGIR